MDGALLDLLTNGCTWLRRSTATLLRCRHRHLTPLEGKAYCPDCGQGVVWQWVRLRCHGCGRVRPAQYAGLGAWDRVQAQTPRCCHCGDALVTTEALDNPMAYQLHQAVLQCLEIKPTAIPHLDHPNAWVDWDRREPAARTCFALTAT